MDVRDPIAQTPGAAAADALGQLELFRRTGATVAGRDLPVINEPMLGAYLKFKGEPYLFADTKVPGRVLKAVLSNGRERLGHRRNSNNFNDLIEFSIALNVSDDEALPFSIIMRK
ncbi:MAG: hypothetical protein ACYCOU_03540 [Sulfobacillus sp.]